MDELEQKECRPDRRYVLAWTGTKDGVPSAYFEETNWYRYRHENSKEVVVEGGHMILTVYCDHFHGNDLLSDDELRLVGACFIDGNYKTETLR